MKTWKTAILISCIVAGILIPSYFLWPRNVLPPGVTPDIRFVKLATNTAWYQIADNEVIREDIWNNIDWSITKQINVYSNDSNFNIGLYFYRVLNKMTLMNTIGELYLANGTAKIFWFNAATIIDGYFIVFEIDGFWYVNNLAFIESMYESITIADVLNTMIDLV